MDHRNIGRATTRRMLLAGAAAGVGTLTAQAALGRPASASDGDAVILGEQNTADTRTSITAEAPGTGDTAVEVVNTGISGTGVVARGLGVGLIGYGGTTGVLGVSNHENGPGVLGEDATKSPLGRGVIGIAEFGTGVVADSSKEPPCRYGVERSSAAAVY